jgi:hypothetical protein
MVVYQFVIANQDQTEPLSSCITHQFSGKRVEIRFLNIQFSQDSSGYAYKRYPLRLDIIEGFTADSATSFDPSRNPAELISGNATVGFFFLNESRDVDLHGEVRFKGYCLGNAWKLQLNIGWAVPGTRAVYQNPPVVVPDCTSMVDCLILTVDVKEID